MCGTRGVSALQRAYFRAMLLCADLTETTHLLAVKSEMDSSEQAKLKHYRELEDRAWLAYRKARDKFIAHKIGRPRTRRPWKKIA